jgi:thioredoxin 1
MIFFVDIMIRKSEWQQVIDQNPLVLIDCFATWCGPCKVISPVFDKLSEEATKVKFISVDVDELPDVAQELGVRAMPTFFAFKDGKPLESVLGANPPALQQLVQKVQQ